MSVPFTLIVHNYVTQGEAAGQELEDATKQSEQKEVCFTEHTNVYITAFGVYEKKEELLSTSFLPCVSDDVELFFRLIHKVKGRTV